MLISYLKDAPVHLCTNACSQVYTGGARMGTYIYMYIFMDMYWEGPGQLNNQRQPTMHIVYDSGYNSGK